MATTLQVNGVTFTFDDGAITVQGTGVHYVGNLDGLYLFRNADGSFTGRFNEPAGVPPDDVAGVVDPNGTGTLTLTQYDYAGKPFVTHTMTFAAGEFVQDYRVDLGSRLDQDQNATTLAKATAEAKLVASLS